MYYMEQNRTLKEATELMINNHGFYATSRQWKKRLNKWGLAKYVSRQDQIAASKRATHEKARLGRQQKSKSDESPRSDTSDNRVLRRPSQRFCRRDLSREKTHTQSRSKSNSFAHRSRSRNRSITGTPLPVDWWEGRLYEPTCDLNFSIPYSNSLHLRANVWEPQTFISEGPSFSPPHEMFAEGLQHNAMEFTDFNVDFGGLPWNSDSVNASAVEVPQIVVTAEFDFSDVFTRIPVSDKVSDASLLLTNKLYCDFHAPIDKYTQAVQAIFASCTSSGVIAAETRTDVSKQIKYQLAPFSKEMAVTLTNFASTQQRAIQSVRYKSNMLRRKNASLQQRMGHMHVSAASVRESPIQGLPQTSNQTQPTVNGEPTAERSNAPLSPTPIDVEAVCIADLELSDFDGVIEGEWNQCEQLISQWTTLSEQEIQHAAVPGHLNTPFPTNAVA